jgi:hypothetical protein
MQQPVIKYPPHVEKLDALDAIKKYNPDVVVASWVTQIFKGDETVGGNMYGIEEEEILRQVKCYIHVGHEKTHGSKRIRSVKHEEYRFPFLFSRSLDRNGNVIYVW